jgi:hypothetical protein
VAEVRWRRVARVAGLVALAQAGAAAAQGGGPADFGTVHRNAAVTAELTRELPPGKLHAATVCLDGYLFAVTTVLGHGSGTPAVAVTQVYAAQDGSTVPATCRLPRNP